MLPHSWPNKLPCEVHCVVGRKFIAATKEVGSKVKCFCFYGVWILIGSECGLVDIVEDGVCK